jgi:serine/threonine-protein kinase RsbW
MIAEGAPGEDTTSVIELRMPSKAEWVRVARLAIAGIASRLDFSMEDVEDLKLAVAEAYTNCIQHAGDSGEVRISCEVLPSGLTVTVEDRGKGYDGGLAAAAAADGPKVGGLGVFLIRTLMDEVSYAVDPTAGTKLTMTKYLRK